MNKTAKTEKTNVVLINDGLFKNLNSLHAINQWEASENETSARTTAGILKYAVIRDTISNPELLAPKIYTKEKNEINEIITDKKSRIKGSLAL